MESIGRLAGGVAHDFNNLLTVLLGHLEIALDEISPDHPVHDDLTTMQTAAQKAADLTWQLLAFARKQVIAPKVFNLNAAIENLLKMMRRLIGEDIALEWLPAPTLWPVEIDPSQIDQVLANLCVNARDAIAGVGKIVITTQNVSLDHTYCGEHPHCVPGDYVRLSVSDTGCGMDKETLAKVFEPFFTTKAVGQGTGLGLATIYGIVKQNNGAVNVYSEPGMGTVFNLYFPRHYACNTVGAEALETLPEPGGHETILLVEDESVILRMATGMLERLGYTVLPALGPGEAMRLAETHPGAIHLLMTDVVMPEMNGPDLANLICALHPKIKCLFMSGYTADAIAHHGVLDPDVHFIQKPFARKALADKIRATLDRQ